MAAVSHDVDEEGTRLLLRLRQVARRAQRLLLGAALARLVGLGVSVLLVVAAIDYLIYRDLVWLRWIFFCLWVGAILAGLWRWFWPLLHYRWSPWGTAMHVEHALPQLGDSLSSTVELLQPTTAGRRGAWDGDGAWTHDLETTPLRRQAILQGMQKLRNVDLDQSLDRGEAYRQLGWMLATVVILALLFAWPIGRLAAQRVLAPAATLPWPRLDHLELHYPARVHQGDQVTVTVQDRTPPFPGDLVLEVVRADSGEPWTNLQTEAADEATRRWTLQRVTQDLRLRVRGGDSQLDGWHEITVVPSPQVAMHQWIITSPVYAGASAQTVTGQRIAPLAGSQVALRVRFSEEVRQVSVEPMQTAESLPEGWRRTVTVEPGSALELPPIVVTDALRFRLAWVDAYGLSGVTSEVWEVATVVDQVPTLSWLEPEQETSVTKQANLVLRWQAEDDLGVKTTGVACEFISEELLQTPEPETPAKLMVREVAIALGDVPAIHPGMYLTFVISAEDTLGQTAQSERRVRIVAPEEMMKFAAQHQQQAVAALRESLSAQRRARSKLEAARAATEEQRAAMLEESEASQVEASRRLWGEPTSASEQLANASRLLRENGLDPSLMEAWERWQQSMADLASGPMDATEQDLRRLRDAASWSEPLAERTLDQQAAMVERLEEQLRTIAESDVARQAVFDLVETEQRQEQLVELTKAAQAGRADAEPLAQSQRALAEQVKDLLRRIEQTEEPRLRQAAEVLEQSAAATQMLEAAAALGEQDLAKALQRQEASRRALADATAAMSAATGDTAIETGERVEGWHGEMVKMRDQQAEVVRGLGEAGDLSALATQEQRLARAIEGLSEQITPKTYRPVLQAAVSDLELAGAGMQRGRNDARTQQAANDALRRLEIVAQALAADAEQSKKTNAATPNATSEEASEGANGTDAVSPGTLLVWRGMQAWLIEETDRQSSGDPSEQDQRRRRLAQEQQALAGQIVEALKDVQE